MKYKNIKEAIFLKRPNRFIAHVLIEGKEEIIHVKNTGRCKELLTEGARVILEKSDNPNRKTRYSLIAVYKGEKLINMDSQVPNIVTAEALVEGKIDEIGNVTFIKREVTHKDSRFDIYYEKEVGVKGFIEVKGVTLENNNYALFPDAPTTRGTKHVNGLCRAVEEGYEANILFLVQMNDVELFSTNKSMDKNFAESVEKAIKTGVNVLVYDSFVREDEIVIGKKVDFKRV